MINWLISWPLTVWWLIRGVPPEVRRQFGDPDDGTCMNRANGMHCYCWWEEGMTCCDCGHRSKAT